MWKTDDCPWMPNARAWLGGMLAAACVLALPCGFGRCDGRAPTDSWAAVDTIFADGFESGTLRAWHDGVDPSRHRIVTEPGVAHSGRAALEITFPAGRDGGWLTRFFPAGYDSLYVSTYVRLGPGWEGGTKLVALYGSRVDDRWSAFGKAGVCPSGDDFFAAMLVTEPTGNPGPIRFYTYYPDMAREPDGVTCYGRYGDGSETTIPPLKLQPGVWHRIEFWVRLNEPGRLDAAQRFWVDGMLRGSWSGLRLRNSSMLRLNAVQITASAAGGSPKPQKMYVDDLLVSSGPPPR